MKKVILIIVVGLIVAAAITGYLFHKSTITPFASFTDSVIIEVPRGASVRSIADTLEKKGVIQDKLIFRILYRLSYKNHSLQSGEYKFSQPLTMRDVIMKLHKGDVLLHKITIVEGMTIEETADYLSKRHKIDKQKFMRLAMRADLIKDLVPEAKDLEGFLYPDTYMVSRKINAEKMVKIMVERFRHYFTSNMKWRAKELNMSVNQIVTMASLVEKETASREERFLIASVFHNRLKKNMSMGCDPTVIYALKRDGIYKGKLGWKELKYDSPYNTRIYRGLPPGPICNPGIASIEAALHPENSGYLYFVAKDSRTHYFSRTLREHNRAVRKYIIKGGRYKTR